MADIELVIKIPEELVSELNDDDYERVIAWYETTLYCAIKEGTPLPKNHGRLIDEKQITKCGWNFIEHHAKTDAPTIIEADKEE